MDDQIELWFWMGTMTWTIVIIIEFFFLMIFIKWISSKMDGKWQNLIVEKRKRGKEVKRQRVESPLCWVQVSELFPEFQCVQNCTMLNISITTYSVLSFYNLSAYCLLHTTYYRGHFVLVAGLVPLVKMEKSFFRLFGCGFWKTPTFYQIIANSAWFRGMGFKSLPPALGNRG